MELVIYYKDRPYTVLVDESDYDLIMKYTWKIQINKTGIVYARGWLRGKKAGSYEYMHRVIMRPSDRSVLIDHKNGNGIDNRKENLRFATKKQNAYNSKAPLGRDFKGVELYKGRWAPRIAWEGIRISMGRFDTKEEALSVYEKVASKLHGEFYRDLKVS